jgi:hypothetical protein
LSATMCEIICARGLLPADCFEPVLFARNTLRKIKTGALETNPKAAKLYNWIKEDLCRAIKTKVLEKVVMSVYSAPEIKVTAAPISPWLNPVLG